MAPRLVLRQQLEMLVDFLEENKEMFRGLVPSRPMTQEVRQKWISIAKKLNAVESGFVKSPERWKKYWFEWRHRCRRKAEDARKMQSGPNRVAPLNDLETRVLEVTGSKIYTRIPDTKCDALLKPYESFLADDSDSQSLESFKAEEQLVRQKKPRPVASSATATQNDQVSDDEPRSVTPPPKWALEIEERRIAAQERMAAALEAIASVMKSQEERQIILHKKLADSITSIAGTVQDLNSGVQETLQKLQQQNPVQSNGDDFKGQFIL